MKRTMTIIGLVLVAAAALLVGAAMFLVDHHEEASHLYSDYQAMKMAQRARDKRAAGKNKQQGGGMELRGHWGGLVVAGAAERPAFPGADMPAQKGVAVVGLEGGRAGTAGVNVGDVIVALDQKPVKNLADLYTESLATHPGTPVLLDVQRQGQLVTVVLPPDPMAKPAAAMGPSLYCPRDGILVPAVTAAGAMQHQCPVCNGPLYSYGGQPGGM